MSLHDIIGQEKAIGILSRTIRRARVMSSYLFAGDSGIGKRSAAVNFVKALNCLSPVSRQSTIGDLPITDHKSRITNYDSCDECNSCRKINAGIHPDLLLIEPETGQIRIEEIRRIDEVLSLKSFEGKYKAVIIDEADTLNQYAANALLKTLEEPPEDTIIVLIASRPDRLPDTIRSRCALIRFTPLSLEACEKVIKKISETQKATAKGKRSKTGVPPDPQSDKSSLLARLSMGRPGNAVSENLLEEREWFFALLKGMLAAEKDGWSSREEMERWFDLSLIMLRDMAVMKITGERKYLVNFDIHDYLRQISGHMDLPLIIDCYRKLSRLKGYLHYNLNKSLTWNYTGCLLRKDMENAHA